MSLTQKIFAINGIVAESIGLEPMPRKYEERVSNPLQYQLCLTLRVYCTYVIFLRANTNPPLAGDYGSYP